VFEYHNIVGFSCDTTSVSSSESTRIVHALCWVLRSIDKFFVQHNKPHTTYNAKCSLLHIYIYLQIQIGVFYDVQPGVDFKTDSTPGEVDRQ